jgi:hypothetical protein
MVVGIKSKIGAFFGALRALSRGSLSWDLPAFRKTATATPSYTAHLSSFAIPKTRAVPQLILVHAIVSQLPSLALGRGG